MLQQTLQPGSRSQFTLVGEFIYIDQTPAPLRIQTRRGFYELEKGAQIVDPHADGGQVTVELTGNDAGLVRIISGYGRYIPPADGQQVNVSQMPAVRFDGVQPVSLHTLPPIAFDGAQPVSLQSLPRVVFDGEQPVRLDSLPAVEVGVLPKVQLETGQAVKVYNAAGSTLNVQELPARTIQNYRFNFSETETQFHLPENKNRLKMEIGTYSSNTDTAYIFPSDSDRNNAIKLSPGRSEIHALYGAFTFEAAPNDTIWVIEYLR